MPLEGGRVRAGLCALGAERRPAAIQPGFGKGPWPCLFVGVPLCARSWLAPTARRQRQGLMAVMSHPQGGRRVLISLWSRPGCAEHDVYAGGRWHRAAGNCWALLHRREAACPGALC